MSVSDDTRDVSAGSTVDGQSRRRRFSTASLKRWRVTIPICVLGVVLLVAIAGPMIIAYDPFEVRPVDRLAPPGAVLGDGSRAWFGTDSLGRGMGDLIVEGARVSLMVGVVTILVAGTIGSAIGVVAGYRRGPLDTFVMRLADIQLAFPSLILAIFIASFLGPSLLNVVVSLSLSRWVVFARTARAQTLAVREREYVEASVALGTRGFRILSRCIVPACVSPLLVVATLELGLVIIAESSLSFIGLGSPPTTPSWGSTISAGRDYLDNAWWIATLPGLVLSLVVVCVGSIGDWLRDRLDPYVRSAAGI